MLALVNGDTDAMISVRLVCTDRFIPICMRPFSDGGVLALPDEPRVERGHCLTAALEAKNVGLTLQPKPSASVSRCSSPRLVAKLEVARTDVTTVRRRHVLYSHRLEQYQGRPDSEFKARAAAIIGIQMDPQVDAVDFSVDEKALIPALDCTGPFLPLWPGRAETYGFEYVRSGKRLLYVALNVGTGHMQGKLAARHTIPEFVHFLNTGTRSPPQGTVVLFDVDGHSVHKTRAARSCGSRHTRA